MNRRAFLLSAASFVAAPAFAQQVVTEPKDIVARLYAIVAGKADAYDGYLVGSPGFNLPKAAVASIYGGQQYAAVAGGATIPAGPYAGLPDLSAGPGTFRAHLMDAVYNLDADTIRDRARVALSEAGAA